jgi:hypothetical protein
MDDADLVVAVAADEVRRHGEKAQARLWEHAEIAAGLNDRLSVEAWADIPEAAERLLGT